MFQRKKNEKNGNGAGSGNEDNGEMVAPPLKPFTKKGSHAPSKPPFSPTFQPNTLRRSPPEIPNIQPRRSEHRSLGPQDASRLEIGRDISLNGEITSCEKLFVEGRAEVVLHSAKSIEVAASGFFKGSVRYGRILIEDGGEITGDIQALEAPAEDEDNSSGN